MEDSGSALTEGTVFESGDGAAPAEPAPLERGGMLSRYMLVERVGLGGMGVVWAAYDPELDRKVAIKLLRPRMDRGRSELARTRLIREAQAMARVTHPNVIAIHDVGEHDGQVFLAMEFVQGKTLRRWVRTTRRDWREIVAMFVQAGRGLAAAHRIGLVHRDFKPANVLIGPDARARVTDFGLARSVENPAADDEPSATGSWSAARIQRLEQNPLVTPLTRTGSMVGTPAYMAPEQFEGVQFDARTDQFAFCVALWESLHGRRPFSGATIEELRQAVCGGKIVPPPSDSRVPGAIDRALRRGLAADPAARWPSMDELLTELSRDPAVGRRRWLIGGAVVASFSAALIVTPMLGADEPPAEVVERCPDPRAQLVGIWDPARRDQLGVTLGDGDRPERWARIAATLDRYANAYAVMRDDVCQAGPEAEPRARCLDDRLRALGLTVELLAGGDAQLLEGADELLASLPPIEACARPRYVEAAGYARDPITPPAAIEPLRRRMLVASTRAELGRVTQAVDELNGIWREAETLDDSPLRIEALIQLARAEQRAGASQAAREHLEQAAAEAIRGRHDVLAASAATLLIDVVGQSLGDPQGGLRWAGRAEAWLDRIDAPPIAHAQRRVAEAELQRLRGDLRAAEAGLSQSLQLIGVVEVELDLASLGPAERRVASRALAGLAAIARARVDPARARPWLAGVHELHRSSLGAEHLDTARVAIERAVVDVELGDWQAAAVGFVGALPHLRSRIASHPEPVAHALLEHARFRLARAELLIEELSEAEPLVLEGVDAARARMVDVDQATLTLAKLERLRGRLEQADRLLASLEVGPEPAVAVAIERAELRLAQGDPEQALIDLERAANQLAELRRGWPDPEPTVVEPDDPPELAELAAGKGRALMLLGRSDEARVELEQALAIWDRLAPHGHPRSIVTLELLAGLAGPQSRHRSRAEAIRASLL